MKTFALAAVLFLTISIAIQAEQAAAVYTPGGSEFAKRGPHSTAKPTMNRKSPPL